MPKKMKGADAAWPHSAPSMITVESHSWHSLLLFEIASIHGHGSSRVTVFAFHTDSRS